MTHLQAGLSPETIEKARLELNENPDILHQDIQQVRDMIITRPDIGFLRTDDAFILRFLRARKFHQMEAFRLLAQYFQYRQLNLDMFKNFKADDPGIKRALTDGFPGVLENRDHCGRKILLLFAANWDQSRNSFIDILRAILLSLEVLIEDQELQINGFILIIDWSNFSFKQASKLTPSILKLAIEGLQVGAGHHVPAFFVTEARGTCPSTGVHLTCKQNRIQREGEGEEESSSLSSWKCVVYCLRGCV
uniref:Clavesin-1 n=1 Tax=Phasianus colchicus TaxID=9054 RepID=A0A669QRL6_PHACC